MAEEFTPRILNSVLARELERVGQRRDRDAPSFAVVYLSPDTRPIVVGHHPHIMEKTQ
jgi:hypothetical protein